MPLTSLSKLSPASFPGPATLSTAAYSPQLMRPRAAVCLPCCLNQPRLLLPHAGVCLPRSALPARPSLGSCRHLPPSAPPPTLALAATCSHPPATLHAAAHPTLGPGHRLPRSAPLRAPLASHDAPPEEEDDMLGKMMKQGDDLWDPS